MLSLLDRGLAVFPLPPGGKAAPAGWHTTITTKREVITTWPAGSNIGVACRPSQIVGLDLDCKHGVDGTATLRALCAGARQPWPDTMTVATPHGGLHLYYRAPAGVTIPSSIGRWPGIDIRAPGVRLGGYLAGPGSTVDGRTYEITRDQPIARLPDWLTHRLRKAPAR